MPDNKTISTKNLVKASLFTALMIIGSHIKYPLGPVPIVFSNFFILLAGVLLSSKTGLLSVCSFLTLGLLGFPVFSNGSGFAYMLGPTGGFLLSYLPSVYITSIISKLNKSSYIIQTISLICGALTIYITGVPWLKFSLNVSFVKALSIGANPVFLIGDSIKIVLAIILYKTLRKTLPEFFAE